MREVPNPCRRHTNAVSVMIGKLGEKWSFSIREEMLLNYLTDLRLCMRRLHCHGQAQCIYIGRVSKCTSMLCDSGNEIFFKALIKFIHRSFEWAIQPTNYINATIKGPPELLLKREA